MLPSSTRPPVTFSSSATSRLRTLVCSASVVEYQMSPASTHSPANADHKQKFRNRRQPELALSLVISSRPGNSQALHPYEYRCPPADFAATQPEVRSPSPG